MSKPVRTAIRILDPHLRTAFTVKSPTNNMAEAPNMICRVHWKTPQGEIRHYEVEMDDIYDKYVSKDKKARIEYLPSAECFCLVNGMCLAPTIPRGHGESTSKNDSYSTVFSPQRIPLGLLRPRHRLKFKTS